MAQSPPLPSPTRRHRNAGAAHAVPHPHPVVGSRAPSKAPGEGTHPGCPHPVHPIPALGPASGCCPGEDAVRGKLCGRSAGRCGEAPADSRRAMLRHAGSGSRAVTASAASEVRDKTKQRGRMGLDSRSYTPGCSATLLQLFHSARHELGPIARSSPSPSLPALLGES